MNNLVEIKKKTFFKGFLDSASQTDNLKVGTKVEFPLWLAKPLKNLQNPVLSVEIPKIYKEGYRCDVLLFV